MHICKTELFEYLDLQLGAPARSIGYDLVPEPTDELIFIQLVPFSVESLVDGRMSVDSNDENDDDQVVYMPYKSDIFLPLLLSISFLLLFFCFIF
jgi:hypothetical protein